MDPRKSPRVKPLTQDSDASHEPSRSSSQVLHSPVLRARSSSKLRRHKSKPHLKRLASASGPSKFVFSVDDDIDDDFKDVNERDYLEGYSDALKLFLQLKRKNKDDPQRPQLHHLLSKAAVELNILASLISAEESIRHLDENEDEDEDEVPEVEVTEPDANDTRSIHSLSSSETIESLNLRDRQNAINTTHPFGIKIWKPSLYKKNRSVAVRADEDIHDFDPHKTTQNIFWGVWVTNAIWSCTFGLLLFLLCSVGAVVVFVLSGFAIHHHSRPYVKLLFKLGRYLLFPFGKFVLLHKDKNYIEEDELDGRSITEFQRWRLQEEGRLFFAPPRRYTSSNNDEGRPLLKDHKGRPLRDAYQSLGSTSQSPNYRAVDPIEEDYCVDDDPGANGTDIKVRFFGRGSWSSGRLVFYLFFYGILQPVLFLIGIACWLAVFTIPMSNITNILCDHLRRHPLALHFELEKKFYDKFQNLNQNKNQSIILCTYRCAGWHYYKYTIDGTNIFFINLLAAVVYVVFDFYVLKERLHWDVWYTDSLFLFCACLFSIIPLAYFIGQAVASISAQSSMGVGAVINAFFSTVVEIFLYCVALNQSKGKLVEGSMIGSILGGVLLLPGLSMCGGALKRKTQRYNPRSAGVSSTMLLFAMVIMFAPSFFYQLYGPYEIKCKKCSFTTTAGDDCVKCRFFQPTFSFDELYLRMVKPFSLIVAGALFLAYVCGLFFTLRTHASLIWATTSHEQSHKQEGYFRSPSVISFDTPLQVAKSGPKVPNKVALPPSALNNLNDTKPSSRTTSALPSPAIEASKSRLSKPDKEPPATPRRESLPKEEEGGGGHDAPNWSRSKSTVILLGATLLYAVIAEILVDNVDAVLADYPINPKFLGLTVFALVPNTTEFLNAISFAVGGNVALSMEIGSAYALQVVLIQIPSLVVYSIVKDFDDVEKIFSLVFPRWDIIATLIAIYLFIYVYAEGKSNYFKGVILILSYFVLLIGFWLNDKTAGIDDDYLGGPAQLATLLGYP